MENTIVFSYDVVWELSSVKWASRWDAYLSMRDSDIHWFSIVNSFIIVAFLSAMVAMIMVRILRKDLYTYNAVPQDEETQEEAREETGWKLVYGDVFRCIRNAHLRTHPIAARRSRRRCLPCSVARASSWCSCWGRPL